MIWRKTINWILFFFSVPRFIKFWIYFGLVLILFGLSASGGSWTSARLKLTKIQIWTLTRIIKTSIYICTRNSTCDLEHGDIYVYRIGIEVLWALPSTKQWRILSYRRPRPLGTGTLVCKAAVSTSCKQLM